MLQEHIVYVCMYAICFKFIYHLSRYSTTNGARDQHHCESKVGTKKKGGKRTETMKIHNTTPGPNVRRKRKGQGKNKTHYYVYMVGSEKVDINTRGHAAESEKKKGYPKSQNQ